MKDVLSRIEGEYVMDKQPAMEGRFMSMVLSPKPKK
jgi:translation initiation factor IF-3